jgi:phosphate transport system permease protein
MHFGRSLMAGAATLALLLLPMVVISSREALRTVPHSMREACYALGGDKWKSIRRVVLPMSLPGILTGIILSVARAVGETAPLVTIGALSFVTFVPNSIWSDFSAIPIQVFNWVSRPQVEFHANAAAGVIVLLSVMLALNAVAIWLRIRLGRRLQ